MTYRLRFSCGATYEGVLELPEFSHRDQAGRGRLCVYDSEGGTQSPLFLVPTEPRLVAQCLCCTCRKLAGRKQIECFPSDESRPGRRTIVTCYAAVEEVA